jgi:membrane fusion protein, copper/silver efflux system
MMLDGSRHDETPPGGEPLPEGVEHPPRGVRTMAAVRWALVGVMAAVAAAAWIHVGRATPAAEARAVERFHCPMHPAVVQDGPGDCRVCGMRLVATERAGERAATSVPGVAAIALDPERLQLVGVKTARVARRGVAPALRAFGVVAADEGRRASVTVRYSGYVKKLRVKAGVARVRRGEVLATVYSPELVTPQLAFVNSVRWARASGATGASPASARPAATAPVAAPAPGAPAADDPRARLRLLGVCEQDLAEIERRMEPLQALAIRSPIDGWAVSSALRDGAYVEPGAELFDIADLSTVWVLADVAEGDVGRVRVGQRATLRVAAYPDRSFAGRVEFVYPALSGSRTLQARIALPNPDLLLRPGLHGDVRVDLGGRADALAIPAEALVETGDAQYVFVAAGGGRLVPRRVVAGARAAGWVEVLDGVSEGDAVVTTGNFLVDSESRLQAALEGFDPSAP